MNNELDDIEYLSSAKANIAQIQKGVDRRDADVMAKTVISFALIDIAESLRKILELQSRPEEPRECLTCGRNETGHGPGQHYCHRHGEVDE